MAYILILKTFWDFAKLINQVLHNIIALFICCTMGGWQIHSTAANVLEYRVKEIEPSNHQLCRSPKPVAALYLAIALPYVYISLIAIGFILLGLGLWRLKMNRWPPLIRLWASLALPKICSQPHLTFCAKVASCYSRRTTKRIYCSRCREIWPRYKFTPVS